MHDLLQYIYINSGIRFGKPCVKDTRIAALGILEWLAAGMTFQEIMQDFPSLKVEHIRAALFSAANRETYFKLIAKS